jgi:hypothetical protein
MGEERSSTWPTVTEVAVTPGDVPDPPELFPPVGVEAWVVDEAPGFFDEHAASVTTDTESRTISPVRGESERAQPPRRARIRTLSRFAFTGPPSVPNPLDVRLSPESHPKLATPVLSRPAALSNCALDLGQASHAGTRSNN